MKIKEKLKTVIKVIGLSIGVYISISAIPTYAAWNNNAYDYVQSYGETLQYKDGAFWFAQYGQIGGINTNRYAIIGFNTKTTFNGGTYSFSSKVGSGGTFALVNETDVGNYRYSLWKLDYNKVVARLKKSYPTTDFLSLSSGSVNSTYEFNAIMSIKYAGYANASGSINDSGGVISNPVYTTAQSIIDTGLFYATAQSEIRKLFGIITTVPASSKNPIKPDLIHFSLLGTDYVEPNGVYHWVKPTTEVKTTIKASIPSSYGDYPETMYFKMYKGDFLDNIHLTMYNTLRTKVLESWQNGSIGNITQIANKSSISTSVEGSSNVVTSVFTTKFLDNGSTYNLRYTSAYNGQYNDYTGTNLGIKVDGAAPVISGGGDSGWVDSDVTFTITASDSGSGIKYIKIFKNGTQIESSNGNAITYTNSSSGTTYFDVKVSDNVGNITTKSFTHHINKTKPIIKLTPAITGWTKEDVEVDVDITVGSGLGISQQRLARRYMDISEFIPGGDYLGNDGFIATENGIYTVYARDSSGMASVETINITNIDRTPPTGKTYIQNRDSTGFNILVGDLYDSESGINRVEIFVYKNNKSEGRYQTIYTSGKTANFRINASDFGGLSGFYSVDVRVFDNAGNGETPLYYNMILVDYPSVNSEDVQITNHEYQNEGIYWVKSGDAFTVKVSGYTTPASPLYEITKQYLIGRDEDSLDYTTYKAYEAKIPNSLGEYISYSDINLSNDTYNSSLSIAPGSYSIKTEESWTDTFFNLTLSGQETIKLSPVSRLEADNKTYDSNWDKWKTSGLIVKSDSKEPSISLTETPKKTWTNEDVTVDIGVTDIGSGINNWTIRKKIDNGSWVSLSNNLSSVVLSDSGVNTLEVTAIDNVGNSTIKSISVNIDKIAPNITLASSLTSWTNKDVTVTANVTDTLSGVAIKKWASGQKDVSYFANNGTVLDDSKQFIATSNSIYTVYAKDNVGNEVVKTINISNIDKSVPTVSINTIEKIWKNEVVEATVEASDSISGIDKIEYKLEGAMNRDWMEYEETIYINVTGKTTVYARAKDLAGNVSAVASKEVWYDTVVPEGTFLTNAKTTTGEINIKMEKLIDINSGVKEVLISNESSFIAPTKYLVSGKESDTVLFILDKKSTSQTHYSVRTIYIRLYDNASNYKDYQIKTELTPAAPNKPIIILPKDNNPLYLNKEKVILKWIYNSSENDYVLPQTKANILLVNEDTNKKTTVTLNGDITEHSFDSLEYGQYTAYVSTYNISGIESEKSEVRFRYNKFLDNGLVRTIKIQGEYRLRYILVELFHEVPKGCSIEGKIYYKYDSSGVLDTSKFVKFDMDSLNKIIKLPEKSETIQVDLIMKNSTNPVNPYISPILDEIVLYAK